MKDLTAPERKDLQDKLFKAQMDTEEDFDIVKSRSVKNPSSPILNPF